MTADETLPVRTNDDLLAIFHNACKPASRFLIGPEMEKFGVFTKTGAPIPYAGGRGVLRIFDELVREHGWYAERELDGGPVLSLKRDNAAITLEPGGQFELSGAAARTIHEIDRELRTHLQEIAPISEELGITWLGLGFHPFAKRSEFEWVPKSRYPLMREYFPTRGEHGIDMMLRTATIQANYDFSSEADAMKKMRVALALAPLTTAIFANSPWYEGAPHGGVTYRGKVWLDVDAARAGLLPALFRDDASFAVYAEWALDAPMFMFKRGGRPVVNTGQTFRSFMKDGFNGHFPNSADWEMHLGSLFPEVRLKKTIEIRGADAQGPMAHAALPALWTGIFYDSKALDDAYELSRSFIPEELTALRGTIWREGLRATFRGEPLRRLAEKVIEIADGGLLRRAELDPMGRDERIHLSSIRKLVEAGMTPADRLLEQTRGEAFLPSVLKHAALRFE